MIARRLKLKIFSVLMVFACPVGIYGASAQTVEKVLITATNAEDVTATIFLYGMEKGLFKKEGIDLEYRFMPPNLALAAIASGEVDFASTVGSPFRAAARGFPAKVIAVGLDKPLFYIMVQPTIKSPQDLKGKKFAVSSIQGSAARTARAGLRAVGVNPDKDIVFIVAGSSTTRTLAMEARSVEATVVPSPHNIWLRQKGFRELMFAGKHISEPFVGIATSDEKITSRPAQIKKVLRGFLRSLKAVKTEKSGVVDFIAQRFKFDRNVAAEIYDTLIESSTTDGTLDQKVLMDYLNLVKAEGRIEKDVPLSSVVDFRLLREASKEITR